MEPFSEVNFLGLHNITPDYALRSATDCTRPSAHCAPRCARLLLWPEAESCRGKRRFCFELCVKLRIFVLIRDKFF